MTVKREWAETRNATQNFIRILRTEYSGGEKLPLAGVMCDRLGISRTTYGRILQTLSQHGHLDNKGGNQGIRIRPRQGSNLKIGILLCFNSASPVIPDKKLFYEFIQEMYPHLYTLQIVECSSEDKLAGTRLAILNISLLVVFCLCSRPELNLLQKIYTETAIPSLLLNSEGTVEPQSSESGIYQITSSKAFMIQELINHLKERKMKRILFIANTNWSYLFEPLQEIFGRNYVQKIAVQKKKKFILHALREYHPDVLLLFGGRFLCEKALVNMREFPLKKCPLILTAKGCDMNELWYKEFCKGDENLEFMTFCSQYLCTIAASVIKDYFEEMRPLQNFSVNDFRLIPAKEFYQHSSKQ